MSCNVPPDLADPSISGWPDAVQVRFAPARYRGYTFERCIRQGRSDMSFREDALADNHLIISGGAGAIGCGIVSKLTAHGAHMTVNDIVDEDRGPLATRCRGRRVEPRALLPRRRHAGRRGQRAGRPGPRALRPTARGLVPRWHGRSRPFAGLSAGGLAAYATGERDFGLPAGPGSRAPACWRTTSPGNWSSRLPGWRRPPGPRSAPTMPARPP